jgi:hypothetical protein
LQKFDMERFNLTKLNNGHMKEQYTSKCKTWKISIALENLDLTVDINRSWESMIEYLNSGQGVYVSIYYSDINNGLMKNTQYYYMKFAIVEKL